MIKEITIESLLSTTEVYKNNAEELFILDSLKAIVVDGVKPELKKLKSNQILDEANMWLSQIQFYFDHRDLVTKLDLVYTYKHKDKRNAEMAETLGIANAWGIYKDAATTRSFIRQRLNDAIGFREILIGDDDCFSDYVLCAFHRVPIRDKEDIALRDKDGNILYRTNFADKKSVLVITNSNGFIHNDLIIETIGITVSDMIHNEEFRTIDNSLLVSVVNGGREKKYQITAEEAEHFRKVMKKGSKPSVSR